MQRDRPTVPLMHRPFAEPLRDFFSRSAEGQAWLAFIRSLTAQKQETGPLTTEPVSTTTTDQDGLGGCCAHGRA